MNKVVPLIRWFTAVPDAYQEQDGVLEQLWETVGRGSRKGWAELRDEHRAVILADAGAGKTFELMAEARRMADKDLPAFFIRIEDIHTDFGKAFEVGSPDAFEAWLAGTGDAWFFLDSVDEVRLDEPRAFENALTAFATRIHNARHRAHVTISSRPYAWRGREDRAIVEALLPYEPPQSEQTGEGASQPTAKDDEKDAGLRLYRLSPLDADDIRIFAGHRNVEDADALLAALDRAALFPLAQLPFDLEDILATWTETHSLESRLAVLQSGIMRRLAPPRSGFGKPALTLDRALEGARALALAATLSSEANIRMPGAHNPGGIEALTVLNGWDTPDVTELLTRGVFSDAIYGHVRFRHREIRELLTAEWFGERLQRPQARAKLEGLLFRSVYGEEVIPPRLRPILPWLILFDEPVRIRALRLHPEIATEGGDAAQLPLATRRNILADMVARIIDPRTGVRGGDNHAVARIAQADLADDTLVLIEQHASSDDAIFFLGRIVWQGEMRRCAVRLAPIAASRRRGIYARIVSARAVASVAGEDARRDLWRTLLAQRGKLPRRLLAELVEGAAPDEETVGLVLASISKLPPYKRFETTGLSEALQNLIDRLPLTNDRAPAQPLAAFATGLHKFLSRRPHVERGECRVSTNYRWLMAPAMHCVERLVEGRARAALAPTSLAILRKVPALRFWGDGDDREHESALNSLIPRWTELNDALFWRSVTDRRAHLRRKDERLTDEWQLRITGAFWAYGADAFSRVVGWIGDRRLSDDREIALTLAFRIYVQNERPAKWREALNRAVGNDLVLKPRLARMMRPPASPVQRQWREDSRNRKRLWQRREEAQARYRDELVDYLKANPDVVREPLELKPGEMSQNQASLLQIIEGEGLRTERGGGSDWQILIPEFGESVAQAFRDGAQRQWRLFTPGIRSDGTYSSSIPYALIFAMAGLEIEAGENGSGLLSLPEQEARHAMRYFTSELNGFPWWFEPLYRAWPQLGHSMVWGEAEWELAQATGDEPLHYLLHDIVYHAPWLHTEMAEPIRAWLTGNDAPNTSALRYARHILISGGVAPHLLAELAAAKALSPASPTDQRAAWFALWTDTAADPDAAISGLEAHLAALDLKDAGRFAEEFTVTLIGGRHEGGPSIGRFRTPDLLARLYVLIHRHIRVADDIERAGKGVYSPTRRDNAQDARNAIFNMLAEIPGEQSYRAMIRLTREHPERGYRAYMHRQAHERAVADGELEPWTAEQVRELEAEFCFIPGSTGLV